MGSNRASGFSKAAGCIALAITLISAQAGPTSPDPLSPGSSENQNATPRGGPQPGSIAPVSIERHVIREFIELAETRRIDIVGLGDSNQLYYAFGWQDGWSYALAARHPMYASPILGAGRNVGIGLSMSVNSNIVMVPLGAPAEWAAYNNPLSGVDDTPYGYLTPVIMVRPGIRCGMRLDVGHNLWDEANFNAEATLRAHFSYGVGPMGGGMNFVPGISQTLGLEVLHTPMNSYAEKFGILWDWVDYPAGVRNENDLEFNWFQDGNSALIGPFFGLYMRFENLEQSHGFSNHTLYWAGGASARTCAVDITTATDQHLITYFDAIRALQPPEKKILIRLAFGGNDRTDSLPSVGPIGGLPSNTSAGVADNHHAIINRIKDVWQIAGWDEDELTFLLVGNHYKAGEPKGFGFRDAIAAVAKQRTGVAFVNLAELADPLELSINEWYYENGAHLTPTGYRAICSREMAALLDLPEDLNLDCVVDTADLGILLTLFGKPNLSEKNLAGDFNFDGQIDTSDLGRLISKFNAICPDPGF